MTEKIVVVPAKCDAYLKTDIRDILTDYADSMIGAGVAYERIIARATKDAKLSRGQIEDLWREYC